MNRLGAAVLGVVVLAGCAYYNTLYNAERLYAEAEGLRQSGRDSLARARYQDVIRKTADAYRGRPTGDEAARMLFLLGRAQLQVGQPREAQAALLQAASLATEPGLRPQILVSVASASARVGERAEALGQLAEAFDGGLTGRTLGEAYLLRGRLQLTEGNAPDGWNDLEQAVASDVSMAVDVGVEGLRWGVARRDLGRARSALGLLLLEPEGVERLDTISSLISAAAVVWSPSVAATMLGDVESSAWESAARSRLELQQATLLLRAGDEEAAEAEAWRVARGRGESVVLARLLLADWQLSRARDFGEAQAVVPILLPVGDDPRAAALLDAIEDLDRYAGIGLDQPLGWFAAAEVARDRLNAPILARGLFLAYADTDPSDSWAPKALLAALDASRDPEDRSWLRGRLEAHRDSPYVQAAWGGAAWGFDDLEEELRVRLSEIAAR